MSAPQTHFNPLLLAKTRAMPLSAASIAKYTPGVLSILPMLYMGWSDGVLGPSEFKLLQQKIKSLPFLTKTEVQQLKAWSDPKSPPDLALYREWVRIIRQHSKEVEPKEASTLAEFSLEIAKKSSGEADKILWADPSTSKAINSLTEILGPLPQAPLRTIFPSSIPKSKTTAHRFPVDKMQDLLDDDYKIIRNKVRRLLEDPIFKLEYPESKEEHRTRTLDWCRELARQGYGALSYPAAGGGQEDMGSYAAIFETLGYFDLSLVIKFGVQFGLFGGAISSLGTESHHKKYLPATGKLELAGCFAMTETGHGSNVRGLQTTATYDSVKDEIIIHTPTKADGKEYIGNALHSTMSAVFAQLIVGGKNHGVHAILVPLRNEKHKELPGIRIIDNGYKLGLNGVDNGRIWFDQVRVPRANLLNRFGHIDDKGNYESPIESPNRRFFTMLGTLVGGRVCVPRAGLSAAKTGLAIAINYGNRRRQFASSDDQPENILLDYPTHQRRLMPLLAKSYALDFALTYLTVQYLKPEEGKMQKIETLAAGMKSYATWFTTKCLQECREACGGKGYLWENRLADLKADSDIFTTFEGDNTVLMQLVAKGLLSEFKKEFHDEGFRAVLRMLSDQVGTGIRNKNFIATRTTSVDHLRDPDFYQQAFHYREKDNLYSVSQRMRKFLSRGMDAYDAFLRCQTHLLVLAEAFVERKVLTAFSKAIPNADEALQPTLINLRDLYALHTIEENKGWYLEQGFIRPPKSKAIRNLVTRLCAEVRRDAAGLVAAFGIPEKCLGEIGVSK